MSDPLYIFEDGPCEGVTNMARDEHLLHEPRWTPGALRIYGWNPPTLSLGCFQDYAEVARLPQDLRGWDVLRRPTGGGAILHDQEVTYCLTLDSQHPLGRAAPAELYRLVHTIWQTLLEQDGVLTELAPEHFPLPSPRTGPFYCFQKPGRTDLINPGGKVLGSAQRRLPNRVLQHGSLQLARPADRPGADLGDPDPQRVQRWVTLFIQRLGEALELTPQPSTWPESSSADIAARRARYLDQGWTERRERPR